MGYACKRFCLNGTIFITTIAFVYALYIMIFSGLPNTMSFCVWNNPERAEEYLLTILSLFTFLLLITYYKDVSLHRMRVANLVVDK